MKKKKPQLPDQAERAKRGAASSAKSTVGRSRVFKDHTIYDRTGNKKEVEMINDFEARKTVILEEVPKEFHDAFWHYAWEQGHADGESQVLWHLEDIRDLMRKSIYDFKNRVIQEEHNKLAAE
jgi:hypothetical protein